MTLDLPAGDVAVKTAARFGAAVAAGGVCRAECLAFLTWAAAHDAWFATLPCPRLRLEGTLPPDELARRTEAALEKIFA